ncbi:hypothetical protein [Streptomyces botrytidirepellens]|uniref:Transcriptional regulator n=1 Tax=Streptomyces botrytidirepellens TaxID=2486417 RepID=A0A3M8WLD2_9ACTN|nr:hypothetical protein [Streptomyces botrytidirepellens]RNG30447.1 hypothetical protein EEJ42_10475 [Streptomyces botrytidirepellens]
MTTTSEWGLWGKYGADTSSRNKHGGKALQEALEEAVREQVINGGLVLPVTTPRGLAARLNYLHSTAGLKAMREAGISQTDGTIRRWHTGQQRPRADTMEAIDDAYWLLRDRNVRRNLSWLRRRGEHGIVLEIYPVDQDSVDPKRRRAIADIDATRSKRISPALWQAAIDAFEADNEAEFETVWEQVIADLDSDWRAYIYVSHVGLIGA